MRLGTYSTFDCPTKKSEEAFDFLREEFEKIGGRVRIVDNPHDFGLYPSFEIDYPHGLEDVDEVDGTDEELARKDAFEDGAREIEKVYSDKFSDYL